MDKEAKGDSVARAEGRYGEMGIRRNGWVKRSCQGQDKYTGQFMESVVLESVSKGAFQIIRLPISEGMGIRLGLGV